MSSKRAAVIKNLVASSHRLNFAVAAARLRSGMDRDRAFRDLDTLLGREYGDMFWMYGLAGFYHSTEHLLHDTMKAKIRQAWKLRTPYRGDTENHFLMYYSSLFLMSEVWPMLPGSEWFTGQSSDEIYEQSKEYLLHWMRDVGKYGQVEFDSPRYQYYFYTPLILLTVYARDYEVKQLAKMTLELLLADYAIKYRNGNYAGAHSRTFDAAALTGYIGETGSYGEYFFADEIVSVQPDLGFVALTEYECPEIIRNIARNKAPDFVIEESKQPRKQLRYTNDSIVTKYTYMGNGFSLGSLQAGVTQPIQQQSWKLLFDSKSSPNTVTGLHPYISAKELAAFFPEEPALLKERIELTKAGYSSEDKWIGGSPHYSIAQEKNVLLAVFDIPEGITSQYGDLFIPKGAIPVTVQREENKLKANVWQVFKFNGIFFGIQLLKPMEWIELENGIRLRGFESGAYAIVAERLTDSASFFVKIKQGAIRSNASGYSFTMKGIDLKIANTKKGIRSPKWLYRSPYINSVRGSGIVTLTFGREKRILNFVTGEIH